MTSKAQRRDFVPKGTELLRFVAVCCTVLTLLVGGFSRAPIASAQDASPTAVDCNSPGLPPGTPTPQMEGSPVAVAAAGIEEVVTEASPEAGTPADQATAAEIEAAVQNYAACYNTGDPATYIAIETASYLQDSYGTSNVYDAVASESENKPFKAELQSIKNPLTYADGRVSADIEVILGAHWFLHETMFFAQEDGIWKLDEEAQLTPEPPGDTAVVGVALGSPDNEYSMTPNVDAANPTPVLIFNAMNGGKEAHELVVLQLPEGADPKGLFDGTIPFDKVTFIGATDSIPPGGQAQLALLNLDPGTYTLLCFLPSPDGTPHAALGMYTQFTINAPA